MVRLLGVPEFELTGSVAVFSPSMAKGFFTRSLPFPAAVEGHSDLDQGGPVNQCPRLAVSPPTRRFRDIGGGDQESVVGGFMEQVADSLVKQGLDSFNKAITSAGEDATSQTDQKKDIIPQPSLIKMIFRSVFDVVSKKIRNLFK